MVCVPLVPLGLEGSHSCGGIIKAALEWGQTEPKDHSLSGIILFLRPARDPPRGGEVKVDVRFLDGAEGILVNEVVKGSEVAVIAAVWARLSVEVILSSVPWDPPRTVATWVWTHCGKRSRSFPFPLQWR